MVGRRFGRLLVLRRGARGADTRAYWVCSCDCGGETVVSGKYLRTGVTRSCGCLGREWSASMGRNPDYVAKRARSATHHGHKRRGATSIEYKTWLGMKSRCDNPNDADYPNWGGRGISVCRRWDSSFEAFLADMGPRPSRIHQIDRLNPNGDYEPGNCRWVLPPQQASENRRTLIPVTVNEERFLSLAAACRRFGVPVSTASERIRSGMPPPLAVSTPVGGVPNRRSRESYLPFGHPDRRR